MTPIQLRGGAAVRSLLFALTALATAAALIVPNVRAQPIVQYCRVSVTVDYTYGISYRALLRMAPDCSVNAIGRVRKVTYSGGLIPGGKERYDRLWGWNMNLQTTFVPLSERWTLFTTRWEWWDGKRWQRAGPP